MLLSDSAWLYALMALFGLAFGVGGSPIGWTALVALLIVSFATARLLRAVLMPVVAGYFFQMLTGAIAIFVTLGTQLPSAGQFLDLGWTSSVASTPGAPLQALAGGVFSAVAWWRGGRLAAIEPPSETLGFSFRVGLLVMATAAVIDVFNPADLNIFPLMFLFFASGLVGLSVSHILPPTGTVAAASWPRVIGATVSAVLVVGLLVSALQRGVLAFVASAALWIVNGMTTIFFFVVVVPIAFVVFWLIGLVKSLLGTFIEPSPPEEQPGAPVTGFLESIRDLQSDATEGGGWLDVLLQVIQWVGLTVVVLLLLFLMARAFRRRFRWRPEEAQGVRETMSEDNDPASDLAQLLLNLVPKRMRQQSHLRHLKIPDDEAGIVDVFRLYFGMLLLADKGGHPRGLAQTAGEYEQTLEGIFPTGLVRTITAAFNRACYGRHPAPPEQIAEMRTALERLSAERG